jgi:hypothetical protein
MTLTGCDTCGHSLACHADPLPVLHGNQRRAIGTVDLGSVSVPLYEVLDGTVTIG